MGKEQETKVAETSKQNTSGTQAATATNEVPQYILDAGKKALDLSWDRIEQGATPYTDERVAGFNPDQENAFQGLRDAVGTAPVLLPESLQGARDYGSAPAQNIDFFNLMDPNSPLGPMSGYMNPYSDEVLQNTLQKIYDAADKARLNLGARATSANAYGDARHGIEGGLIDLNTQRAVGETSSQLLKQMFDTAMGWRSSDMGRLYNTDTANAGFNETAIKRGLEGSGALLDRQGQDQNMLLQRLAAMLGAGQMQQGNAQAVDDAKFQEFLRQQGVEEDNLKLYTSILSGIPYEKTVSSSGSSTQDMFGNRDSTTTSPDNSLWQLAGTLAGAALAPATGGASLALPGIMGAAGGGGGGPSTAGLDPFAGTFMPGYA